MSWSTSQLACLADTTTPTVRHHHRVELLEAPERLANGWSSR